VFVPVDRLFDNETINYLRRRGHFGYFVFEELDKDRSIYQNISKYDFINNFEVSDDIVVNFQNYVNQRERTDITFVAYNDEIRRIIKATLARQLFDDNAFEEIINKEDIMVQEVILLSSEKPNFIQD
jgi:carboxyl-terminal processing protease